MLDFLGGFGLGLLRIAAMLAPFGLAVFVGQQLSNRGVRTWLCWAGGIVALCLGALIFQPAVEVLTAAGCQGASDYQACIDGDDQPTDWI